MASRKTAKFNYCLNRFEYRRDGKLHRTDGPAVIGEYYETWYKHGKRHRKDAAAHISGVNRSNPTYQVWYTEGRQHRVGGPAKIRSSGTKLYFNHGKLHRLDGPAIDITDTKASMRWQTTSGKTINIGAPSRNLGMVYDLNLDRLWAVDGKECLTPAEFQKAANLSDEQMFLLLLEQPY